MSGCRATYLKVLPCRAVAGPGLKVDGIVGSPEAVDVSTSMLILHMVLGGVFFLGVSGFYLVEPRVQYEPVWLPQAKPCPW